MGSLVEAKTKGQNYFSAIYWQAQPHGNQFFNDIFLFLFLSHSGKLQPWLNTTNPWDIYLFHACGWLFFIQIESKYL